LDQEPYGIMAIANHVGFPQYADPQPDPIWGYTRVDERILEKFNCDFRYLTVGSWSISGDPKDWQSLPNGWIQTGCGVLWKPGYGVSRQGVRRMTVAPDDQQPAARLKTLKDMEEYPYWVKTDEKKTREALEEKASVAGRIAKKMHEETDYAISGGGVRIFRRAALSCSRFQSVAYGYQEEPGILSRVRDEAVGDRQGPRGDLPQPGWRLR
jgi:hypothetical protein